MTDPAALSAYLAEYDRLRAEIDSRTAVLPTLLTIELASLGAGVSIATELPEVTLVLALIADFLWLVWLDQANQVRKIAAYLSIELAPRVRETAPGALGWEAFLRRLESGGDTARNALGLPSDDEREVSWSSGDVATVTTLLFGFTPPALVATFVVVTVWDWTTSDLARLAGALVVTVFWMMCVRFYRRVRGTADLVTSAILESAGSAEGKGEPN